MGNYSFREGLEVVSEYFSGFLYPTPYQTELLAIGLLSAIILGVLAEWFYRASETRWRIIVFSSVLPLLVFAFLRIPQGFSGTPDDHCDKYEGGRLVYELVGAAKAPIQPDKPFGEQWFLLFVRASRWGDEIHQCRLSANNAKARFISGQIMAQRGGLGFGFSRGAVTFTFGGHFEEPNVKWAPKNPPSGKPGPPEEPRIYH